MSYSQFSNLRESWPRGDPEIEASLVAPSASFDDIVTFGCAHEGESGYRHFNQNSTTWVGSQSGGDVLIADSADIAELRESYPDSDLSKHGMMVVIMEDDHERCQAHDDDEEYNEMLASAFVAGVVTVGAILVWDWLPENDWNVVYTALGFYYTVSWTIRASQDDDLIGGTEFAEEWNQRKNDNVTRTHVIFRNDERVGTADLHARPRGYY